MKNQIVTMLRRHWLPLLGLNSVVLARQFMPSLCKHDYSSNLEGQCRVESSQTTGDVNASLGTLGNVQSKGVDFTGVNPLEIQLAILTSNIA